MCVLIDFSIRNDIKFNPIKSVCIVFKPKISKLYCPNVKLDCDTLEYISCTTVGAKEMFTLLKQQKIFLAKQGIKFHISLSLLSVGGV